MNKDVARLMTGAELRAGLQMMHETLPEMCEFQEYQAKLLKAKFNGLVKAGFTEVQALELCKGGI